jgi:arginase
VTEEQVWLIGARDLDPGEHGFLARAAVHTSLDSLPEGGSSRPAHLHIDLDVLDPAIATVNQYASPNGLSPDQLHAAIARIAAMHHIAGATLSAYDPAADPAGAVVPIAFALCEQIAAAAAAAAPD